MDRVQVLRDGATVTGSVSRSTRIGDSAVRSGDQLIVPERSWLSRNVPVVVGAVGSLGWIVATVIRN
jgi:hypothetical protein